MYPTLLLIFDQTCTRFLIRKLVVGGGLLLLAMNANAETSIEECGWMQRTDSGYDEPLTKQELIEMRELEIESLANQSEHCLSGNGNGNGNENGAGGSAANGSSGIGSSEIGAGAGSSASAGAPNAEASSEAPEAQSRAGQATSNKLAEDQESVASASVAKGSYQAPIQSKTSASTATVLAGQTTLPTSPTTTTDSTLDNQPNGTGIGAPRVITKSADNKERLRQQLREKIAATDDPEVKRKLQERLDAL